jgi:RNA polymerase sigma-70 factor (ECF subfamily)
MAELEDIDLWRRSQAGDADAFSSLFDRHANTIYGFCFRRTADWALAEDLTSVVFLEAWRRRQDVDLDTRGTLPWLLGVATNVVRNQERGLRRYRAALDRIPPLEPERDFADGLAERLDAEARMRSLLAEIRRLPQPEQDVLLLSWAGLSSSEIAAALNVAQGTVRTRLFRSRRRLDPVLRPTNERAAPQEGVNSR